MDPLKCCVLGWIMRIKWLGATLSPPVSASLPNQTQRLPVISSYYLACRRSPRVVKIYSNLPCGCGSLIVEVNIPRRDDSERRSTLGADPAPISFLVSFLHDGTQPERERERQTGGGEEDKEEEEGESHPPNGNGHFKRGPGKWAVPHSSLIGDEGIKRAPRRYSKGY